MRTLLMTGVAVIAFAGAARADAIYDFTFTNGTQLDGQGTLSTGAASTQDAGYFLLTGLTFTALRDANTGTLDTGSLTQTSFAPGSAYDPTTEAFVNHLQGKTSRNYGGGHVSGSTAPNDFSYSTVGPATFALGDSFNHLEVISNVNSNFAEYSDVLAVTPQNPVPEPASLALLGTGLLGLGLLRRRPRRRRPLVNFGCPWPHKS